MLGLAVSERTVSRYLPQRRPSSGALERWIQFLRNHRGAIAAMNFFTVPTATFRVLYVWFAIDHARRRILHFDVTDRPTAAWVVQQLREAFPHDSAIRHLIFDRDEINQHESRFYRAGARSASDEDSLQKPVAERSRRAVGRECPQGTA